MTSGNPQSADETALLELRKEFPILERSVYLISNSLGAMPRGVYNATREYCDVWASRGVRAWEEQWWDMARVVGDEIGQLMNAQPGTISCHQNVTQCEAIVGSCLDFSGKRNKVVYTEMNFPSVMYFWEAQRTLGARIEMIKTEDDVTVPLQKVLDAIDEETLIVPISHVFFRSAYIQDARAIVEKAHKVGALVLLDCFHSVGTMPVDVQALGVDFATGGVLKWLCGGPGTCYLYVRPDLAKTLKPKLTGWVAHEKPFRFDIGATQYTNDTAYRFMNGTPNIAALYCARPGLKIIREAGMERIRAKSKRQTEILIKLADERGWTVKTPRDREQRGGTVSIDLPNGKEICAELLKRDVVVDFRYKAGLRMSPHFYTTDEELHAAVAAIEEVMSSLPAAKTAR